MPEEENVPDREDDDDGSIGGDIDNDIDNNEHDDVEENEVTEFNTTPSDPPADVAVHTKEDEEIEEKKDTMELEEPKSNDVEEEDEKKYSVEGIQ